MSDLYKYFSRRELLKGREVKNPLSQEQEDNLIKLIKAINPIRKAYGKPMYVSSGYRPLSINASAGGAKKSAHLNCQAVDIKDQDGLFANWCLNNLTLLEECGIYLEDPRYTIGWVHLDIRGPKSGKRVFIP